MKRQYLFCLLVAFIATNSYANNSGWSSVSKKPAAGTQNKSASRNSNALVSELLSQVQQMQQEMSELRGLSEQQAHEIRLLKQSQKASYQDVDKRLRELSKQQSQDKASIKPKQLSKEPTQKNTTTAKRKASSGSYKTAMQLVRAKKYNQAIKEFDAFYKANPKSKLAANSLYWMGEIQMVKADIKGAEANFLKVTQKFPNHLKSADAHYKLAMIKHKQGDVKSSKAKLKALIENYSGKSDRIVRLAKAYLKRLEKS